DEPTPADQVRARFGGEWMERDVAASIAAVRSSLEAGHVVSITGPTRTFELAPFMLQTNDLTRIPEVLARATVDETEQEPAPDPTAQHRAQLARDEQALADAGEPAPPRTTGAGTFIFAAVLFLVVIVPALVTRLITWPFRGAIRRANGARADRRRH